jgi:hypothetical protein
MSAKGSLKRCDPLAGVTQPCVQVDVAAAEVAGGLDGRTGGVGEATIVLLKLGVKDGVAAEGEFANGSGGGGVL